MSKPRKSTDDTGLHNFVMDINRRVVYLD